MKSVVFILMLAIGGSMGSFFEKCEVQKCNDILPRSEVDDLEGMPPNEEELKKLCPLVLETIDCATNLITECSGQSIDELAASDNKTVAMLIDVFSSIKDLSTDMCNEDSTLHKNYVSGISCFRDMIEYTAYDCYKEGIRVYKDYKTSLNELIDDEEGECMLVGYGIACVSIQLRKTCGGTASDVFLEIIRRLKFVKLSYCNPNDVMALKTKFLDFLEEQGEQRDFYHSAFDFRRRK